MVTKSSYFGVLILFCQFVTFDDLDDEESYRMLRERERRQVLLWNYAEKYFSSTEFGDLVIQQRSQMVHWIVEVGLKTLKQAIIIIIIIIITLILFQHHILILNRTLLPLKYT